MIINLVISLKGHGPNWWRLLALETKALASVIGNVAVGDEAGEGEAPLKQIMSLQ